MAEPIDLEFRTDGPQCPSCGHVAQACEAHHYDEDWTEGECGSCGEPFYVEVHHMGHRWSTRSKLPATASGARDDEGGGR